MPGTLAVVADYAEEGWPSMDLFAEMLLRGLGADREGLVGVRICPRFRRRFTRLPLARGRRWALNADRFVNRHWDYPRRARRLAGAFDAFHVCDHSYGQLVHALPPERTGVYLHDLDAFRSLLEPEREPRPRWFRWMMRRVLRGVEKAAVVFHSTGEVRRQILRHGVIDPARLVWAPPGTAPEFTAEAVADAAADNLLTPLGGAPFLLHVGSCIPRKRMDVLIGAFAAVRAHSPELRLVKVGGPWTPPQQTLLERLRVAPAVTQVQGAGRRTIAALYQRAALVLLPSEAEGFGLPVAEALACGASVLASDIPVLREVGGEAVTFCSVGDVPAWTEAIRRLLVDPSLAPSRPTRLAQAERYSWEGHVRTVATAYRALLDREPVTASKPLVRQ
jgi:glycosyltransferase involved in cell wall biosynthesis